jgi:hypothetical protein
MPLHIFLYLLPRLRDHDQKLLNQRPLMLEGLTRDFKQIDVSPKNP